MALTGGSDRIILALPVIRLDEKRLAQIVGAGLERDMRQAVYKLGQEARDIARAKAPKKTGALAASIYVTRPNESVPDAEGKSPTTKRMTAGYFRAINAAVKHNKKLSLQVNDPGSDDQIVANHRTQLLKATAGVMAGKVTVNNRAFRTQKVFETDDEDPIEALVQSILPFQKGSRASFFVVVGAAAHYAGFVEFGHVAHGTPVAPVPFLVPAIEWASGQIAGRMKAVIEGRSK